MSSKEKNLIEAMQQPSFYDHPAETVELIETHISWVFLAGEFAFSVSSRLRVSTNGAR